MTSGSVFLERGRKERSENNNTSNPPSLDRLQTVAGHQQKQTSTGGSNVKRCAEGPAQLLKCQGQALQEGERRRPWSRLSHQNLNLKLTRMTQDKSTLKGIEDAVCKLCV